MTLPFPELNEASGPPSILTLNHFYSASTIFQMNRSSPATRFDELVFAAENLVHELERWREPEFEAVLQHVLAYPEMRDVFADKFVELIMSPKTDGDLFEFCMHALRWPEVKARTLEIMIEAERAGNRRLQFWLGSALQCFEDIWSSQNRTGYKRFE